MNRLLIIHPCLLHPSHHSHLHPLLLSRPPPLALQWRAAIERVQHTPLAALLADFDGLDATVLDVLQRYRVRAVGRAWGVGGSAWVSGTVWAGRQRCGRLQLLAAPSFLLQLLAAIKCCPPVPWS